MFQIKVVVEIKTHILGQYSFPPKNRAIYEIMWKKYCRARQTTDGHTRVVTKVMSNNFL